MFVASSTCQFVSIDFHELWIILHLTKLHSPVSWFARAKNVRKVVNCPTSLGIVSFQRGSSEGNGNEGSVQKHEEIVGEKVWRTCEFVEFYFH